MGEKILWFERKFDFSQLNGTFPSIYERLEGLVIRLKHKLESIPQNHLNVQQDGKWSIKEHIGHLIDLEELWLSRMEDFEKQNKVLTPADLENAKTHNANHNRTSIEDLIGKLAAERKKLLAHSRTIWNQTETLTSLHPRLQKPMRAIDLAYFVAEHDDHHLAAISNINKRLLDQN